MFQTKIWRDKWFEGLTQTSKLVFMYLFTNQFIGLTGIYELTDRQLCFDVGINQVTLDKVKQELYPKVKFHSGWVYVTNAEKHDPIKGENNPLLVKKQKEIDSIPKGVYLVLTSNSDAPLRGHDRGIDAPQGIGKGIGIYKEGVVKGKPSVEDLTPEVLEKISQDYKLPLAFVTSKADDLKNWCSAKGKVYKDYPAALRNWVKKDAERIVQAQRLPSKSFDATTGGTYEIIAS